MKLPTTRGHGRAKLAAIAYRTNASDRIEAGWYPIRNLRWLQARMALRGQSFALVRFPLPAEARP